jgi:hypothetical protein
MKLSPGIEWLLQQKMIPTPDEPSGGERVLMEEVSFSHSRVIEANGQQVVVQSHRRKGKK